MASAVAQVKPKAVKTRGAQFVERFSNLTVNVRAVKITEKNFDALNPWLARGGATSVASTKTAPNGDIIGHKIELVQDNFSKSPGGKVENRRAVRVARLGDWLVRYENGRFGRIKARDFDRDFTLV